MTFTVSIADDDVFTALGNFLVAVLPSGVQVIQLQDDGVAMPSGPFVGMNNASNRRLETNTKTYTDTQVQVLTPSAYTMTLDFYGPNSGQQSALVQSLFRDEIGCNLFPSNIRPLYADDPMQIPLINGEQQWEQRWRLQAVMQTNTVITTDQQSANALSINTINPVK